MNEARLPFDVADRAPVEPHGEGAELPADFFPLRLVLQPAGFLFDLARPDMILGRHSEADIRLALPDISRRHCRFLFESGHWRVIDLHSLNGVHVNGVRVNEATLSSGDLVRVGSLILQVDFAAAHPDQRILPGPGARSEHRKAS